MPAARETQRPRTVGKTNPRIERGLFLVFYEVLLYQRLPDLVAVGVHMQIVFEENIRPEAAICIAHGREHIYIGRLFLFLEKLLYPLIAILHRIEEFFPARAGLHGYISNGHIGHSAADQQEKFLELA